MDAFGAGQVEVLERIAAGEELSAVLTAIVRLIEGQAPAMTCSILHVDEARGVVHGGVGPNLPPAYLRALEGAPIGPAAGSCGTAAALKRRVIVEDIAQDPLWVDYRELALGFGLAACWSTPILAAGGEVLGTFAMYYPEPRRPTEEELVWVDRATHLAAIALGRRRAERALKESELRAQRAARLHAMASSVNEVVARASAAEDVGVAACRAIVDSGLVLAAQVGVVGHDLTWTACGDVCATSAPLEALLRPSGWRGAPPAVAAAIDGAAVVVADLEGATTVDGRAEATREGLAACGAFPLRVGDARGALALFAAQADRFGGEEIQVFGALAESVAFAMAAVEGARDRARLVDELGDRVKELSLLHAVSRLLQSARPVDEQLFSEIAALIPGAMRHAAVAAARLTWGTIDVATPNWRDSPWRLSAEVDDGASTGLIEVAYVAPTDAPAGATFLDEERELMRSVADMLGSHLRRVEVERALREREALLGIAGQVARIGGWSFELASGRVSWSDELRAIYELPAGTPIDVELALAAVAPEYSARVRGAFEACVAEGVPFDLEVPIVTAGGRRIWVRALGQAERHADGAVARVLGAVQDIVARRKLEEQLRQAQKLEAIGQLAGGIAHDFNNLLSVILSCSSLAMTTIDETHPLWRDLAEIDRAASRAGQLTSQLLAFGRRQILQPRVMDLNRAVSAAGAMLRRVVGEEVAIETILAPELGQVFADPGQIEQVIVNLAINARDAMPDGGTLTLETANVDRELDFDPDAPTPRTTRFVQLAVTDTGVGMDAAMRARIFEPFFTTKEVGKGTGLGLAMVWGIVEQSGGHVWVYSEVGIGTTFKIYLPRVDAPVEPAGWKGGPRAGRTAGSGCETILLVEDEDQVRAVVGTVLRRAGYAVLEASDGPSALALAADHRAPIDLLLTDVSMPKMTGPALAARLGAERPGIKVLYISGYTENAIVHHGVLDEGVAFLAKPFTPAGLIAKVGAVLEE